MILPDIEINGGLISPFDVRKVTPAGYDLTSLEYHLIYPRRMVLAATVERVSMPNDVLGILHLRTTFTRQGLFATTGTVDPGYVGQLTMGLLNANEDVLVLNKGERFLQINFIRLEKPSAHPYMGKYQGSVGVVKARKDATLNGK